MLTIASVNVGNYRGMGARYVNALYRGCARNLTVPFRFVCFTDDAVGLLPDVEARQLPNGLDGCYNKLALFRPEAFALGERVLYFDLDTVILGSIDFLAAYDGPFAVLHGPWGKRSCHSGVMLWTAGELQQVWDRWVNAGHAPHYGGDQAWIEQFAPGAFYLQSMFPQRILSFKADCARQPAPRSSFHARVAAVFAQYIPVPRPKDATVVYFHGMPKPDNCRSRWVRAAWDQT